MYFEDFRDLMDTLYEDFNSESSIRITPPTDQEKFHMLMAIEAYFLLLEEEATDFFARDRWNEMLGL
jgi:hypothetical protein